MKHQLTLLSIFIVFIGTQAQQLTFRQDKDLFRKCIEDHLLKASYLKIGDTVESIARMVANGFHNKTYKTIILNRAAHDLYAYIKRKKSALFYDNKVPEELRVAIKEALYNCIERKNLPQFDNESRVLASILDYILVDWPTPLNDMILTHEGRSRLRLYGYVLGLKLMSALKAFSMNYDIFRRELQRIWSNRAQQYFDGRDIEFPYLRHRFTIGRDRIYSSTSLGDVHTIDDANSFILRSLQHFIHRNPITEQWSSDHYLNILDVGASNSCNVSLPENFWYHITSAEYYLETHIDQCYRILFFILEMQLRGISTDEDDVYNGPIPYDVLPLPIQKLAWNGAAYRNYLMSWREHLEHFPRREWQGCFSSRTKEELIILLTFSIIEDTSRTAITKMPITTTTTTTTSTVTTSTESSHYNEGSRKGGTRTRDYGKFFLPNKRFRLTNSEQNQQHRQSDYNKKYHGYIIYSDPFYQPTLTKDYSTFFNILSELNILGWGIGNIIKNM